MEPTAVSRWSMPILCSPKVTSKRLSRNVSLPEPFAFLS
jgi:hypothetical protein